MILQIRVIDEGSDLDYSYRVIHCDHGILRSRGWNLIGQRQLSSQCVTQFFT